MEIPKLELQVSDISSSETSERMQIIFCIDRKYVQHLGVAMTSIAVNNYQVNIDFHVIHSAFNQAEIEKFSLIKRIGNNNIRFYLVEDNIFADLKIKDHFSSAVYYRFLIPYVLPESINKVLYLDADLVCNDSLLNLWHTQIDAFPVAAVAEEDSERVKELDMKSNLYFNSGVMLINLQFWRQESIALKALEFVRNNPSLISFLDQDALNKVIDGNFLCLETRWNNEICLDNGNPFLLENDGITHFVGSLKPWHPNCTDPRRNVYWKYLKLSPWSDKFWQLSESPEEKSTRILASLVIKLIRFIKYKKIYLKKLLESLFNR
jgi:lipopolysaccharide biosynthesis glycosyltransferase